MNYIVLDLEWNQCPYGKKKENKKLPFEIIEIGAVKLDEHLNRIDTFSEMIKPKVYQSLHYKIKEISKITMDDLKNCRSFSEVVNDFLDWCTEDSVFCTWGSLDLMELQRNIQYFKVKRKMKFPLIYLDIQKLFSIDLEDGKIRRSLSDAVEYLQISEEEPFHRAVFDAIYTCRVMEKIHFDKVKSFYSIDCYYVPRNKKEEIYAHFDTYNKYISRKFGSKETALADGEVNRLRCFYCDKQLKEVIPWFSDNSKVYYAVGYCEEHGYMKSKIRMKKTVSGQNYVTKTTKPTTSEGCKKVAERQDAIREKRRERRFRQAEDAHDDVHAHEKEN